MIAIAFVVFLLILAGYVALTGQGGPETQLPLIELSALALVFGAFFLMGIYVAAALGLLALLADVVFSGRDLSLQFGQTAWDTSRSFLFMAIPLFLLMGEILMRTGLSNRLYRALNLWVGGLPGGLMHTNVASAALFSAISGTSVATAATVGAVALPYFRGTNYPTRMVLGSIAAGGALGNLIPPGIAFLIYGLFTDTSIGQLYAAGAVAGVIVTAMFMGYIALHSLVTGSSFAPPAATWRERVASLWDLVPVGLLIITVVGTLYLGLATASEAAALGVVGAMILAAFYRQLSLNVIQDSLRSTTRTTAMIGFILFAAVNLNYVLGALHLPAALASVVTSLPLPPILIMLTILAFYIAVGTFMDSLAMMITTLPVIFPIVMALGYDPVWFGVAVVMVVEIALISPPDGMVMYVLQGLRKPPGPITDVFYGVLPFVGVYIFAVILFFLFPGLILWPVK
jgi:C4-dicarboxylate transporter DctM subunit